MCDKSIVWSLEEPDHSALSVMCCVDSPYLVMCDNGRVLPVEAATTAAVFLKVQVVHDDHCGKVDDD
jgi:hypothetical protein